MAFPIQRLRRLRKKEPFRRMVRETALTPNDFIYPVFVTEGRGASRGDRLDAGAVALVDRSLGEGGDRD